MKKLRPSTILILSLLVLAFFGFSYAFNFWLEFAIMFLFLVVLPAGASFMSKVGEYKSKTVVNRMSSSEWICTEAVVVIKYPFKNYKSKPCVFIMLDFTTSKNKLARYPVIYTESRKATDIYSLKSLKSANFLQVNESVTVCYKHSNPEKLFIPDIHYNDFRII